VPCFDLLVRGRLHRRCSTKCRYSKESGSCKALPTGCRRSRGCCLLDNRRSIDSYGDENIRNSGGVGEVGLRESTFHNVPMYGFRPPRRAQATTPRLLS
jgi:hypothetical protein